MSLWHTLVDLFLPRHCVVCDSELTGTEHDFCNVCLSRLPVVRWGSVSDNPLLRSVWSRYDVEAAGSSLYYNTHSDFHNIFIALKYQACPQLGRRLAQLTFPHWHSMGLGVGVDYIIPVPLSVRRRLRRGYNQSEWIARGVSSVIGKPVCTNVLKRMIHNPTQTRKTALQRWNNVDGIFSAVKGRVDLNGRTVLLVDDIMTTGATLCACMRALKEAYPSVRLQIYTLGWAQSD